MTLQDFLLPLENVKFHSKTFVQYADKKYKVLISDKRIILYAQRGHLLKSDDIVSERIDRLQGIEYTEKGFYLSNCKNLHPRHNKNRNTRTHLRDKIIIP